MTSRPLRCLGLLTLLFGTAASAHGPRVHGPGGQPLLAHLPTIDRDALTIADDHIELAQPVFFAPNRKRIRGRFREELVQLARVLIARADLGVIAIEGHADATGPVAWNLELSRRRASQIVAFLVAHDVPAERLRAAGYGEARPLVEAARGVPSERNRRVQFYTRTEAFVPGAGGPTELVSRNTADEPQKRVDTVGN